MRYNEARFQVCHKCNYYGNAGFTISPGGTSVEIWANDLQTQSVFKKDLDQIPRILSTYKYNSADSAVIPISKTDTLAG